MPSAVAKALGLSLMKTFGRCYSMDSKQIPLLGQIKDAQVVLADHPNKGIKMTILIADIPVSYGMLLSYTFCRDLGGGSVSQPKGDKNLWLMEFDGSCAVSGFGAGVVLILPSGTHISFYFKVEFKNTNNMTEYEALLLGLAEVKKLGIKLLRVKGYAELIVKQVKGLFYVKNERLKHYCNRAWDEIEDFDAFSIEVIPRE
ncbi:uncharacterized protein LOC131876606 [Cryptomeria japonica]|uniref:uncharacterized protein LOC131876606 n=1 Tax=Cryptomeria japonica TaxID=3369 RepID=UPI0027DA1667|nr:uncharacterized protein LOC131876606 [Cryptomeria japonica]